MANFGRDRSGGHASLSVVLVLLWISINCAAEKAVIGFTIPPTIPANASQILDPRFAGFGIEFSNIFSYTGTAASPNTFSSNVLQNLKQLTGVSPCIRLGGDTSDYALYRENFTSGQIGINPNPTLNSTNVTRMLPFDYNIYGPALFSALGTFPTGTQIIFGLNMACDKTDYIIQITSAAAAASTALNNNLYSFEIGNEPDLFATADGYRG